MTVTILDRAPGGNTDFRLFETVVDDPDVGVHLTRTPVDVQVAQYPFLVGQHQRVADIAVGHDVALLILDVEFEPLRRGTVPRIGKDIDDRIDRQPVGTVRYLGRFFDDLRVNVVDRRRVDRAFNASGTDISRDIVHDPYPEMGIANDRIKIEFAVDQLDFVILFIIAAGVKYHESLVIVAVVALEHVFRLEIQRRRFIGAHARIGRNGGPVGRPLERFRNARTERSDRSAGRIVIKREPFDGKLLALPLGHQIQQILVDLYGHLGLVAQQPHLRGSIEIIDGLAVPQHPGIRFEIRHEGSLVFAERAPLVERVPVVIGYEMHDTRTARHLRLERTALQVGCDRAAEEPAVGIELQ